MWQQLNKKSLQLFLVLAFFVSQSLCLFSAESPLTENEIRALTEEQKVQAIMILDQALTDLEKLRLESEQSLMQRESDYQERLKVLQVREIDLNERETLLVLQESLSEDLISQKNKNYLNGFRDGSTVGGLLFGLLGGLVMYNVK